MTNPYKAPDPMYGPAFARSKQNWLKKPPADSPFQCFHLHCARCGTYQVRLHAEFDEAEGEMQVSLVCLKCGQREPVRQGAPSCFCRNYDGQTGWLPLLI